MYLQARTFYQPRLGIGVLLGVVVAYEMRDFDFERFSIDLTQASLPPGVAARTRTGRDCGTVTRAIHSCSLIVPLRLASWLGVSARHLCGHNSYATASRAGAWPHPLQRVSDVGSGGSTHTLTKSSSLSSKFGSREMLNVSPTCGSNPSARHSPSTAVSQIPSSSARLRVSEGVARADVLFVVQWAISGSSMCDLPAVRGRFSALAAGLPATKRMGRGLTCPRLTSSRHAAS